MKRILFIFLIASNSLAAQPVEYDMKLGAEATEAILIQTGLYEDIEMQAYINKIGYELVDQLSKEIFEYNFFILDDPTPNAFALPGGFVFVTRGLLALIENMDELACVMGHEIVHVQKRHSIQQLKHNILPNLLQIPGKIVGSILGDNLGNLINAPISAGTGLYTSSYSRKHETESDNLGIVLAARAGFDPNALSGILDRIIRWEETLNDMEEQRSYFSDHPYTPDRIDNIQQVAPKLEWTSNDIRKDAAKDVFDGMLFWKNPKKGVFVENQFLHPEIDFSIDFPEDWQYFNRYNAVGAIKEGKNTFIYLTIESAEKSPKKLGKEFLKELKKSRTKVNLVAEDLLVNDSSAYMIQISEEINKNMMRLYMLWVQRGESVYKITAMSDEDLLETFNQTVFSLKSLDSENRVKIMKYELRFTKVGIDETLEQVGNRSGNKIGLEMLYRLNGMKQSDTINQGEEVKIIQERPY